MQSKKDMQNNKYYIFLIHRIYNIAGMQLYVSRKVDYLKSQGWNPLVYYYTNGLVEIPNLKQYEKNYIPSLRFCVGNVSNKKRKNVLAIVKNDVKGCNEIVVESCSLALGTWGEYLADKLQCKHILYVIDEFISSPTKLMADFINYKINQKLFYCIKPDVLTKHLPQFKNHANIQLKAVGTSINNVTEYDNEIINSIPDNGKTILCLGRLDKPYVEYLFQCIAKFIKVNHTLIFNVIIIGDAENKNKIDNLLNIFKGIKNISIHYIPNLWPLPAELFRKSSVALGSAGSINICSRQGVPSISIDFNDLEAIGILRVNTQNTTYRNEKDPKESIVYWLKHVLIDKRVSHLPIIADPPLNYESHQRLIDMEYKKEYYPVTSSIYFARRPHIRKLLIILDQISLIHKFISKYRSKSLVKSIIQKFNN